MSQQWDDSWSDGGAAWVAARGLRERRAPKSSHRARWSSLTEIFLSFFLSSHRAARLRRRPRMGRHAARALRPCIAAWLLCVCTAAWLLCVCAAAWLLCICLLLAKLSDGLQMVSPPLVLLVTSYVFGQLGPTCLCPVPITRLRAPPPGHGQTSMCMCVCVCAGVQPPGRADHRGAHGRAAGVRGRHRGRDAQPGAAAALAVLPHARV